MSKMKAGITYVRHEAGQIDVKTVKRVHWLGAFDENETLIAQVSQYGQWKPYTAANMLKAMKARNDFHEAKGRKIWEQYAKDFPCEVRRDERLNGVNAQLEVTGREYAPTSLHAL